MASIAVCLANAWQAPVAATHRQAHAASTATVPEVVPHNCAAAGRSPWPCRCSCSDIHTRSRSRRHRHVLRAAASGSRSVDLQPDSMPPAAGSLLTPTGWHPLNCPSIWKGTEEQAVFRQATPYPLSPSWKVILLSDGSVTRHLQLMTNQKVEVECLEQRNIGHERAGLPAAAAQIEGPLVQRQVLLHIPDPHSKAYVYAASWWNAEEVDEYLKDRSQPIWVSLSQGRTELYRDILQLELGHCPYLEGRFQAEGPFWGRQYLFWHGGKPLTLIYEVFSTSLSEFLGSPHQQAQQGR